MVVKEKVLVDENRLWKQKYRIQEIVRLQNRMDEIDRLLSSPHSATFTDMPRSQNPIDRNQLLIEEKTEKSMKFEKEYLKLQEENKIIRPVLDKICQLPQSTNGPLLSVYRDLLVYFFLDNMEMKDILIAFGYEKNDESKLRLLHKWRKKALTLLYKSQN